MPETLASIAVEEVLLLLKIAFLVLLYLFIWRIVRTASKDLRAPQESFILAPQRPANAVPSSPAAPARLAGRLVVVASPALRAGDVHPLSAALTVGRSAHNDLAIDADQFASASHARFEPRGGEVWVSDQGSTNGTFVNGKRLVTAERLERGDIVRVGETDLRFER